MGDRTAYMRAYHARRYAEDAEYRARMAASSAAQHSDPAYVARKNARRRARYAACALTRAVEHARYLRRRVGLDAAALVFSRVLYADPCCYCGARDRIEVDHIVPVAAGGGSEFTNLTAACRGCNAEKYDKPMLLFMLGRRI